MSTDPFITLLVAHLPRLRAYAMILTRNRAAAEDLLQETSYRALRGRETFTMGTNFTAWIFRILRNSFISSLRRAKRTATRIDNLPESVLAKQCDQEEIILNQQIVKAVKKLRPGQRQVLTLVCENGLTYNEAAETLNCSVASVKSLLWRARQHIQAHIEGPPAPTARTETPTRDRRGVPPSLSSTFN
jgi:RNA polymerase sigma-70 factor (ECF subfamily)